MVRIDILKPVSNFMTVHGHRIMCGYRGVTKVCSRCAHEANVGKECNTPCGARCEVYGHETTDCSTACHRCAEEHATADCLRPRSYTFAAGTAPSERAEASAASDEPCAAFTSPLQETEETEPGNSDSQQATMPTEEGSTGPNGSAPSFTAEDSVSTPDSASQSSVSQGSSGDADSTDVPRTKYENRPRAMRTLGTRKRQPSAEAPGSQAGPTPVSPKSLVTQCREPSLGNPVSQVSNLLGLSDDMLVDEPDLKRPLPLTFSSADDSAISCKQPTTKQSRTAGPSGSDTSAP
ncbi:hypothetical protein HPB49_002801 [Dermacentor silvarum]|uniref:Uncharacterized protein n=1 Tax=Dermacentor silvarum TaxID=543639 RepID=A0ACB8CP62_DERSI|nr:hypothetical protein HPB49_002801 [Dermacentor silvarum]